MIFAGPNVLRRVIGNRTIVNFGRGGPGEIFEGAFFVTATGGEATVAVGLVNAMMPTINGVPLSGNQVGIPRLDLAKPMLDRDGRGFICVECVFLHPDEVDEATAIGEKSAEPWSIKSASIVQVAYPDSDDGKTPATPNFSGAAKPLSGHRARWPLAMLRVRESSDPVLFQIIYFSLRHRAALQANGRDAQRHFFF